ncbi:hypothetical protein [Streptomyces sp. URMC 125]|uniref:hypothetical protein n=1 Tax=Streptomyces sp. URMC 125 TaxID=3423419 RepID=UPI003F1C9C22
MARNLFGGTASDVAEDIDGRRIPGAVGTVWDGPSDQAGQVTDLTDADGAPIIQLVADNRGFVPPFYGPDGVERLWVDFGVGRIALVSSTVGDRLKAHIAAYDPHQDRAYTDERLADYLPLGGSTFQSPAGSTWALAQVAGDEGAVLSLVDGTTGSQYTRIKNNGQLMVDAAGQAAPLCIGAPGFSPSDTVINVVGEKATSSTAAAVFRVMGDGSVVAAGPVSAANVGNARVFSGPNPPAAPQPGDVWIQYA